MKKLLVVLIAFFALGLQAQDVTGTWQSPDGWKAEYFQAGNAVYAILNTGNFKHFVSGTMSGNRIQGRITRIDLNNSCRTLMDGTWTVNGNNSMQVTWRDLDGACDLGAGQTGSDAPITRTTRPTASPMNGFGGNSFNPSNDVTGSWGEGASSYGDWMQDNNGSVYFIANGNGFKQFFQGTRNGNQIIGTMIRYNPSGCRTTMSITYTQTNANTMQYTWRANDGNCDLGNGQTASGTIVRAGVPPVPMPIVVLRTSNVRVYLTTGTGELRGGNNAYMTVNYSDGSSSSEYNLGGGFAQNSAKTVFVRINRAIASPSEISSIVIRHDGSPRAGHPFDTYGNWTLQAIRVALVMPDGTEQNIINARGNPLVQYSGNVRVRTFNR